MLLLTCLAIWYSLNLGLRGVGLVCGRTGGFGGGIILVLFRNHTVHVVFELTS